MKKTSKLVLCLCMVMIFATACGDKNDPAATSGAVSEQVETADATTGAAVSGEAVSGEAVSPEAAAVATPEPTEEPEVVKTYEVEPISQFLNQCVGIRETSGETLKYACAANALLSYAVGEDLGQQNEASIDNFKKSFAEAYDKLDKKQKKEMKYNMREEIMPIIMDSFQDSSLYMPDFEDAGVAAEWKASLADPNARNSWSVIWEAYEEANG